MEDKLLSSAGYYTDESIMKECLEYYKGKG